MSDYRQTARSANKARVRLLLKRHLWWLHGFPVSDGDGPCWMAVSHWIPERSERITLTGKMLNMAAQTAQRLYGEHREALAYVVGDPHRWSEDVQKLLNHLKPMVHERRPISAIPPDFHNHYGARAETSLKRLPKSVRIHARRASWIYYTDAGQLEALLGWMDLHEDSLRHLGDDDPDTTVLAIRIADICEDDDDAPAVIAEWLRRARGFHDPTHDAHLFIGDCRERLESPKSKSVNQPARIDYVKPAVSWLLNLASMKPKNRRAVLKIFQQTAPLHLLEAWDDWWREMRGLLRPMRKALLSKDDTMRNEMKNCIDQLTERCPPEIHVKTYFQSLGLVGSRPLAIPICDALKLIPDRAFRLQFFSCWAVSQSAKAFCSAWLNENPLVNHLKAFRKYLERNSKRGDSALAFWAHLKSRPYFSDHFRHDYPGLSQDPPIKKQALYFKALDAFIKMPAGCNPEDVGVYLEALMAITGDGDEASRLLRALLSQGFTRPSPFDLKLAYRLWDRVENHFPPLFSLFNKRYDNDHFIPLANLAKRNPVLTGPLCRFFLDKKISRLLHSSYTIQVLTRLEQPIPMPEPIETDLSWVNRWPESLHKPLAKLLASHPDARSHAENLVLSFMPSREMLQRQIDVLEERLSGAEATRRVGMTRRLENLRNRLEQPPSEALVRKLKKRILESADRLCFAQWEDQTRKALDAAFMARFEMSPAPIWRSSYLNTRILLALIGLPSRGQKLGLKILRARTEPGPWLFLDEEANATFVARMESLGLDMKPWLESESVTADDPQHGQVTLALEDDPIELLYMGGYFETCLSPFNFNFSSAVVNTIDINKRVLFARNRRGEVLGRCLLAINEAGGLLTFRPYGFFPEFTDMAANFASKLAQSMNTSVHEHGQVVTLVGGDWWNDGVHKLAEPPDYLGEDSDFRRELPTMSAERFQQWSTELLAPLPPDRNTLLPFFSLPEFAENAELVRVWEDDILKRVHHFPKDILIRYAEVSAKTNLRVARHILREYFRLHKHDEKSVTLLFRLGPSIYLEEIRQLESDIDSEFLVDDDYWVLYFKGRSLIQLNRHSRAAECLRVIRKENWRTDLVKPQLEAALKGAN